MRLAEHRPLLGKELRARAHEPAAARVRRTVLTAVEHEQVDEVAEAAPSVQPLMSAERNQPPRQGLMLVVRLIRSRAPREEELRRIAVRGEVRGVVVVDLVIVGGEHPGARRVRGLEVRIRLVDRVAQAIVLERERLGGVMRSDAAHAPLLINVVADVHDQIEVVGRQRAVGRVVPVLVHLAASDRELELAERRATLGRRARAPDRALRFAAFEPVPVVACGIQARDLDVHRVRPVRGRIGLAGANHAAKRRRPRRSPSGPRRDLRACRRRARRAPAQGASRALSRSVPGSPRRRRARRGPRRKSAPSRRPTLARRRPSPARPRPAPTSSRRVRFTGGVPSGPKAQAAMRLL